MVEPLMSTLKINQNAPSFSLTDPNFTQVHLKELIGKKKSFLHSSQEPSQAPARQNFVLYETI